MKKDLTTTNNSQLSLTKSKNLISMTNGLLMSQDDLVSNGKIWTDSKSSLMWQVEIETKIFNWYEALDYAKELNEQNYCGYSNWRLPKVDELETILTKDRWFNNDSTWSGRTYIKKQLLKSMNRYNQEFWSSTHSKNKEFSRCGYFSMGYIGGNDKQKKLSVRCVRGINNLFNNINSEVYNEIISKRKKLEKQISKISNEFNKTM